MSFGFSFASLSHDALIVLIYVHSSSAFVSSASTPGTDLLPISLLRDLFLEIFQHCIGDFFNDVVLRIEAFVDLFADLIQLVCLIRFVKGSRLVGNIDLIL